MLAPVRLGLTGLSEVLARVGGTVSLLADPGSCSSFGEVAVALVSEHRIDLLVMLLGFVVAILISWCVQRLAGPRG